MEATKVKVRERGTLSSSHMTSNPLSASLPPTFLASPLPSPRLLARPRTRFGIPVSRPASKTTPSYRKIELWWWKPRPSWNRVTLRHACHVIGVHVSPCTSISISRGITAKTMRGRRKGENLLLPRPSPRSKGGFALSANRRRSSNGYAPTGGYATQRVNDELLHLTTV